MASISMIGRGDASRIESLLEYQLQERSNSCTLVDCIRRNTPTTSLCVMVFDKYFWRNSSRASLTVVISGNRDVVCVDAIGSGGGNGALFRISWGAESDFAQQVADILEAEGFDRCGESSWEL